MAADTTPWEERLNVGDGMEKHRPTLIDALCPCSRMCSGQLGLIKNFTFRLDLHPVSQPMRQHPYRTCPDKREIERNAIADMLQHGIIEPSQSEWAAPVVIARKKDGPYRFCVDYRRLNSTKVTESSPIPRMEEDIDSLGDASIFYRFNCKWGYWKLRLHPEDFETTTFTSYYGTYRYTRMPLGFKNARATFQRAIDLVLSSVK